jgi:glycosyltransferase involved in cell wall biosynthesis
LKKKNIAVIGTAGIPANYGGFETLVEYLVEHLAGRFNFIVYCSSQAYSAKMKAYKGARLVYLPINANGKSSILYDCLSIVHCLFIADIILVLGVGGAFLLPFIRLFTNKIIITNIDGLEWKRDKWGRMAKLYLFIQEKIAAKFSHYLVADNRGIENYILEKYERSSELIAYGGSHAFHGELTQKTIDTYKIQRPYAFTVCRIEPENNIHVILKAFSNSSRNLIIVGNWQASKYGESLRALYGTFSNIKMLDPIYDQSILNEIRSNCAIYIHGHSAGGTNPSLVEAMWLGLPIFAWKVNYNLFTTEENAIFFDSATTLENLINTVDEADLRTIGTRLAEVAKRKYSWEQISDSYGKLFAT